MNSLLFFDCYEIYTHIFNRKSLFLVPINNLTAIFYLRNRLFIKLILFERWTFLFVNLKKLFHI